MLAAAVVLALIVLAVVVVLALRSLARARERDELADAEVVQRLRPDGNANRIEADE